MKKIFLYLIILFGIISGVNAYALDNSFYEGEYIPGEYIIKSRGGSKRYEQMKVFRMNGSNQHAYCIELWDSLNSNKVLSGYDFNTNNYSKLDSDTLNRVVLIAYYGYGYTGHTDIKWYTVTQFMIWKSIATDTDLYFTDKLNGNRINKYEDEINEIENLISKHYIKPSFNNTIPLRYNEWIKLQDTNYALENFKLESAPNLRYKKVNNTLEVVTQNRGNNIFTLVKDGKSFYNDNPKVYIDNDGQDLLIPGLFPSIKVTINFPLYTGSIIINKKDYDTKKDEPLGDARLIGSVFEVLDKDNNVIATKQVAFTNRLVIENIPYGDFKVREKKAGVGYNLNSKIINVNVNNSSIEFDYYNKVIKNKIIIHKYLNNPITNSSIDEEGAVFELYRGDIKVDTVKTGSDGIIKINLPYGLYTLKQVSGKKNYKLSKDILISIVDDSKTQEFNINNDALVFNLTIHNLDSDSGKNILESGSIFKIKNIDTLEEFELETTQDGVTDTIKIIGGNYEITEEKVVDGYLINDEKVYLEVNEDNYQDLDDILVSISNTKITSKVEVSKKINYYLNDVFKESKFDNDIEVPIYAKEDIYTKDGIKIYDKDEEVDNVSYDGNRLLSKSLVLGNYYIKDLDNNEVDVVLDNDDTKRIDLTANIYEYEKVVPIVKMEKINSINDIPLDKVIEVENTLSNKSIFEYIYLVFIMFGLLLLTKEKKYE